MLQRALDLAFATATEAVGLVCLGWTLEQLDAPMPIWVAFGAYVTLIAQWLLPLPSRSAACRSSSRQASE